SSTSSQVRRRLERIDQGKAAVPDGISPRVLKSCATQLSGIPGVHLHPESGAGKGTDAMENILSSTDTKASHPVWPQRLRLVALTSHVMEVIVNSKVIENSFSPPGPTCTGPTPVCLPASCGWGPPSILYSTVSKRGAPQGTVLSPFLLTLYTSDLQYNSDSCHLQKFSDHTTVVGCIRDGQESEYRGLLDNFVDWCTRNYLLLNVMKTKEMVVD
ncbi:hypothetical protein QTP86_030831, partial [Hemibagrus guttatus]